MKKNDIDTLLKKNFSKEFCLPHELDSATWQKMKAKPPKKKRFFLILINIAGIVLLALQTIIILHYLQYTVWKATFLYFFLTLIGIIAFYQIISLNNKLINLKTIL